jgi:hypothetical protein
MNDRDVAAGAHESDAWLRDAVNAIHTPAFRAELLTEINALNDERERIIAKIIAYDPDSEFDE